jgi:hypothetical protein
MAIGKNGLANLPHGVENYKITGYWSLLSLTRLTTVSPWGSGKLGLRVTESLEHI